MKRRGGFTLIELLTVVIIIGLLAGIAATRFWAIKGRGYRAAVKSDLRTLAIQQERYFDKNLSYANGLSLLPDMYLSAGVTITIVTATNTGWSATATHASMEGAQCAYFTGNAAAPTPATDPGIIQCNE